MGITVHLVDGTFELFRCFHGAPRARNAAGREVGAVRALLATIVALLHEPEVSHVAVAFDSVVSPAGAVGNSAEELIASQSALAAEAVRSVNVPVWPTGRYQADEMIATAAARCADDPSVVRVVICSNDNDFHQCVRGDHVVCLDRIRREVTDEAAVRARYGVRPDQLPDLVALVGDRSDGLPGVPGWGVKSAAAIVTRYGRLDDVPLEPPDDLPWAGDVRSAPRLAGALAERRDEALLCRDLARLRTDLPWRSTIEDLRWQGADRRRLAAVCATLGDDAVLSRVERWRPPDHSTPMSKS